MNYYQHHIGDFNNASRCLTRVERSVYRDLIELYYDTEKPLTSNLKVLQKLVLVVSDEEKEALDLVLDMFFTLEDCEYRNRRCDSEIEKYQSNQSAKSKAGRISAAKRKQNSTPVEHANNECATNQEPITNNQEPILKEPILKETPASPNPKKPDYDDDDLRFAEYAFGMIKSRLPNFKEPNLKSWAKTIRLMRVRDGRDYRIMQAVFAWSQADNFWQGNVLSMDNLRKQFDRLAAQMNRNPQHEINQRTDTSAAGRVRANAQAELAEIEQRRRARENNQAMATDGLDVWPQVGNVLRG